MAYLKKQMQALKKQSKNRLITFQIFASAMCNQAIASLWKLPACSGTEKEELLLGNN